jgi:hypothetical protein
MEFHRMGWNVVPCNDGTNDPKGEGKGPAAGFPLRRWYYWRQPRSEVEKWFSHDALNVGIITGKPSGNSYALDVDHPDQFNNQAWLDLALAGKLDTWVVKTQRGVHIYERSKRQVRTKTHHWGEVRGMGAYVLAPPSTNLKTGHPYTWLSHPASIPVCEELPIELEYDDAPRHRVPRLAQAIADGKLNDEIGPGKRYKSRSELDAALVMSLYLAGWTYDQVRTWIPYSQHASQYLTYKDSLRPSDRNQAEPYLRVLFHKASTKPDRAEWTQARNLALACHDWALAAPWPGRTGVSSRTAYLMHCQRCYDSGALTYHLASRTQSEANAYSQHTMAKANRRLQRAGLVDPGPRAVGNNSQKWRLRPVGGSIAVSCGLTSLPTKHEEVRPQETLPGHPRFWGVWEYHGLGKATYDVWMAIQDEPLTQRELVERTGRAKGTVSKALATLSDSEIVGPTLARRAGDRWLGVSPADYDFQALGHRLRTDALGALRRAAHERERLQRSEQYQESAAAQLTRSIRRACPGTRPGTCPDTRPAR